MTNEQAIAELQKEHDLIQGEHDLDGSQFAPALLEALAMAIEALKAQDMTLYMNLPEVSAEEVVEILKRNNRIELLPPAQPEVIRCKDCKYWRQQTNYAGVPLSFGFCESDEMWRSLYGETYEVSHIDTDDDFYCGYAERRTDADMRGEQDEID